MEINKQLFEDVLSGKLKGTFVLRDKSIRSSNLLSKITCSEYPYLLDSHSYMPDGLLILTDKTHPLNIEDFIPDTNIKENELTIEIPDGKIVDWEESKKQNKVVLKNKQLTYEDICKKLFQPNGCYYICGNGEIINSFGADRFLSDANNATSKHQLECILAKNQLATVAKYLNDGWKPDINYRGEFNAFVLYLTPNKDYIGYRIIDNCGENSNILFKSEKLAQRAIEILGEKTIKLALEPLGI